MYQKNIFTQIISGELSATIIHQSINFLCIEDKYPIMPKHYLVLPKANFIDFSDFNRKASKKLKLEFLDFIDQVVQIAGISEYKLTTNNGATVGQLIFHFHMHLMSY